MIGSDIYKYQGVGRVIMTNYLKNIANHSDILYFVFCIDVELLMILSSESAY